MLEFFLTLIVSSPFDLEFLDRSFPTMESCIESGESLLKGLGEHELLLYIDEIEEYVGYVCTPKDMLHHSIQGRRDL